MDRFAANSRRSNDPLSPPMPQSNRRSGSPDSDDESSKPRGIRMAPLTKFDSTRLPGQLSRDIKETDTSSSAFKTYNNRLRYTYDTELDSLETTNDRSRLVHQSPLHDRDRSASPEARQYRKSGEHRVCDQDVQGRRSPKGKHRSSGTANETDLIRFEEGDTEKASSRKPDLRASTTRDKPSGLSDRLDRFRFKDGVDDGTSSHEPDARSRPEEDSPPSAATRTDRFRFKDDTGDGMSSHKPDARSRPEEDSPPSAATRTDRFRFKDDTGDGMSSHKPDARSRPEEDSPLSAATRTDRFRFKDDTGDGISSHKPDARSRPEEDSPLSVATRTDRFRFKDSISPERKAYERVSDSPMAEKGPPSSFVRHDRFREGGDSRGLADSIRALSVARRPEGESPEYVRLNPMFMDEDQDGTPATKGSSFEKIVSEYYLPTRLKPMQSMTDRNMHFMIRPIVFDSTQPNQIPRPINDQYIDTWNTNHVRMPCSPNYYGARRHHIWPLIERTIAYLRAKCQQQVATFETLAETLKRCAGSPVDLKSLEVVINETYTADERGYFMSTTLLKMCNLVLNVPKICTTAPPFLRVGSNASVTMSQAQAAALLACAFFLTYPSRSYQTPDSPCKHFPDPNFTRLYQGGSPTKVQKLRCILHYFKRVTDKEPTGVLTFRRTVLDRKDYPQWQRSDERLPKLHLSSARKIEEFNGVTQIDFANSYIGGGVLGRGCVQEEIRFSICPEMIISLLICERMEDNEAIFLIGCEQYCSYTGYADSFKFAGDFIDRTPIDSWSRRCSQLVAMDAILYRSPSTQFEIDRIQRELIKAYVSFRSVENVEASDQSAIATGNWGCGAFNGDRRLKALIQLIAAAEAGRPLIYAAYRDRALVNEFWDVYSYLMDNDARVSDLYKYLERYSTQLDRTQNIFEMIRNTPIEQIRSS